MAKITFSKRLLSMLLVFIMAVGVMATGLTAFAADSGITIEYVNQGGDNAYSNPGAKLVVGTYEGTKGTWEIHDPSTDGGLTNTLCSSLRHRNGYIQNSSGSPAAAIAIRIRVPKAGDYTVTQTRRVYSYWNGDAVGTTVNADWSRMSAEVALYFVPVAGSDGKKVADVIDFENDTPVLTYSTIQEVAAEPSETPALGAVNILPVTAENKVNFPEAGEYYAIYQSLDGKFANFGSLTLNGGEGVAPIGVIASVDRAEIAVGKTAQMTVSAAYDSVGNVISAAPVFSSDSAAATVDPVTGVITGQSTGTANITATVTDANGSASETIAVKVWQPNYSGVKIQYDFTRKLGSLTWCICDPSTGTFSNTEGFWALAATSQANAHFASGGTANGFVMSTRGKLCTTGAVTTALTAGNWMAFRIKVPVAGAYDVINQCRGDWNLASGGGVQSPMGTYILDGSIANEDIAANLTAENHVGTDLAAWQGNQSGTFLGIWTAPAAGEYILVVKNEGTKANNIEEFEIWLDGGDKMALMGEASVANSTLEIGDTEQITLASYMDGGANLFASQTRITTGGAYAAAFVRSYATEYEYSSSNLAVATVDETGLITAEGAGDATIYVTPTAMQQAAYYNMSNFAPLEVKITVKAPKVEDPEAPATVKVYAQAKNGDEAVADAITGLAADTWVDVTVGSTVTVTAAKTVDDLKFVNWKNEVTGSIVSTSNEYSFTAGSNVKLTAQYAPAVAGDAITVTFYNPNGDIVAVKTIAKGETLADIADLEDPTMIGGLFTGWNLADDVVLAADQHVVAQYDATPAGNVTGGNADGSYDYNEEVNASTELDGFTHWKKNGNVVSFDKAYTFFAWAAATLEASAEEVEVKPFAVLDPNKKGEAVMAEYNALGATRIEAGIIFGDSADITLADYNSKAVSKASSKKGQFAAKPYDDEAYARAYLIYDDGTGAKVAYSAAIEL